MNEDKILKVEFKEINVQCYNCGEINQCKFPFVDPSIKCATCGEELLKIKFIKLNRWGEKAETAYDIFINKYAGKHYLVVNYGGRELHNFVFKEIPSYLYDALERYDGVKSE